jgi:hypothetical protein
MTLPVSGAISFNAINVELGQPGTTTANINQATYRALAGVPSGTISLSNFYGKSNITEFGMFGGGNQATGTVAPFTSTANTFKYTFSSDTFASGSALSTVISTNTTFSSSTIAYVAGGFQNVPSPSGFRNYVSKFTYSTSATATGTTLTTARQSAASSSTATIGYVAGGTTGSTISTASVNKYTYSGDIVAAGTNLSIDRSSASGFGNSTRAIFAMGTSSGYPAPALLTSDKYTYSSDTVAAGTSFATNRVVTMCTSTSTLGLIMGGQPSGTFTYVNTVQKYTFSSDAISSGTNLTTIRANGAGIGNSTIGMAVHGNTAFSPPAAATTKDTYTYSSDVVASTSTGLSNGTTATSGNSNVNGGLQ